jgi:hypothetical protein
MGRDVDYTTLTLAEVRGGLEELPGQTQAEFGAFDVGQLNWRPGATAWSVAQCFEHLLTTSRLMRRAADDALTSARPQTFWQRVPVLPGVMGRMLIRSQAPASARKYTAPPSAQPASQVSADIIQRFVDDLHEAVRWVQALDERRAVGAIMTSPFIKVVAYSALDGCRLMLAHDHRHLEQARRVAQSTAFPRT